MSYQLPINMYTCYVIDNKVTISLILPSTFISYTKVVLLYELFSKRTTIHYLSHTSSLHKCTLVTLPSFSELRKELRNETTRSTKAFVWQNDTCGWWHVLSLPLLFTRTSQLHSHFIPFPFMFDGIKVLLRAENDPVRKKRKGRLESALRTRKAPWNTFKHTPPPPLHPSLTIEAETMLDGSVERGRRRKRQRERLQGGPHYTH